MRDLAFSPAGDYIASASDDRTVRLWQVETRAVVQTFRGHEDDIPSVVFAEGGETLITASYDRTVRLWNRESGAEVSQLPKHPAQVWAVSYASDSGAIATG